MLSGKKILLVISGGIAAYKSLLLIRLIKQHGGSVQAILTRSGEQFVTPLSVASLSGEKVFTDLFDLIDETEIGHIELSRSADLVVVAPASADILAQMANGLASDLATTALLATDKSVLVAPAMNVRMWENTATQRNIETLKNDGVLFVGPDEGAMACGEYGLGRMAEPEDILQSIKAYFETDGDLQNKPLFGKKVIITAGPTHEPIDPVRYIANRSSGKQGYALAKAAVALGAHTILISGPTSLPIPEGAELLPVETAEQMLSETLLELPADIAIFAAAVADFRVDNVADQKMKKKNKDDVPSLKLTQNPDILATVAGHKTKRPTLVVGFAAETENVIENAKSKLIRKGCDIIIANDVGQGSDVMGGNENTIHIISKYGVQDWPQMSKQQVADKLMAYLVDQLGIEV